jgi:hypothetical protein
MAHIRGVVGSTPTTATKSFSCLSLVLEHREDKIIPLMISGCDPWRALLHYGNV